MVPAWCVYLGSKWDQIATIAVRPVRPSGMIDYPSLGPGEMQIHDHIGLCLTWNQIPILFPERVGGEHYRDLNGIVAEREPY